MRKLKNIYIAIRYFGLGFLLAVYQNYKSDKDSYDDFWECLQEEFYAMGA